MEAAAVSRALGACLREEEKGPSGKLRKPNPHPREALDRRGGRNGRLVLELGWRRRGFCCALCVLKNLPATCPSYDTDGLVAAQYMVLCVSGWPRRHIIVPRMTCV